MKNKTKFTVVVAICFAASLVISTFQYFETTDFLTVCILYFVLEKKCGRKIPKAPVDPMTSRRSVANPPLFFDGEKYEINTSESEMSIDTTTGETVITMTLRKKEE